MAETELTAAQRTELRRQVGEQVYGAVLDLKHAASECELPLALSTVVTEAQDRLLALIASLTADRRTLAKLASKEPQFFNPLDVWAAEKLRDDLLAGRTE